MNEAAEMLLKQMKSGLAELDREAEELERKRARCRQGILMLRQELGDKSGNGESLTDAILDQVIGAIFSMTAAQVAERLRACGFAVETTTVATILSRLTKAGQLKKDAGRGGYVWSGIAPFAG
jgi:DNA invertase Pin-like site-specific DNA recombinase